jgi:hypothetical protein
MSISLRLLSTLALLGTAFWACAPDLDALSSKYELASSGTGGTKPSAGGSGNHPGTGGTPNPTGGTGATSGTSGDGSGGTIEAGAAGQAGQMETGASGGTSGTSGTGGTGTTPDSCSNGVADSNESDIDCGGSSKCPRCDVRAHCGTNSDCLSTLYCNRNGRCAEPTCSDNVQNQNETGVDCGGACSSQGFTCDDGVACNANSDCTSQFCSGHVCTGHCTSKKREADETDVDCGGMECKPCADGKRCLAPTDCASSICNNNVCAAATCSDNVTNQDESDTDCGGTCAPPSYCMVGQHCNSAADCKTYVCNASSKCDNDLTIQPVDVIDDFEDGNYNLAPNGGRVGNWYNYGDGTGTENWLVAPIQGQRGPTSLEGMHVSGGNFTTWGCGLGVDLSNSGGGTCTKVPYNASFDNSGTMTPYAGITFWARSAAGTLSLSVVFPDGDTDSAGMVCGTCSGSSWTPIGDGVCDHHYLTVVSVGTDWKRYTVMFKDLTLEPGGKPVPTAFDPTRLVSVQFRINPGTTFDFWVDDVAFVRPE